MNTLEVGSKIKNNPFSIGTFGGLFECCRKDTNNTLLIGINAPKEHDVKSFTERPFEFGVFANYDGACILMLKSDQITLELPINSVLPDDHVFKDTMTQMNTLVVIDTNTGIIQGLRCFTFDATISAELSLQIREQRANFTSDDIEFAHNLVTQTFSVSQLVERVELKTISSKRINDVHCHF